MFYLLLAEWWASCTMMCMSSSSFGFGASWQTWMAARVNNLCRRRDGDPISTWSCNSNARQITITMVRNKQAWGEERLGFPFESTLDFDFLITQWHCLSRSFVMRKNFLFSTFFMWKWINFCKISKQLLRNDLSSKWPLRCWQQWNIEVHCVFCLGLESGSSPKQALLA